MACHQKEDINRDGNHEKELGGIVECVTCNSWNQIWLQLMENVKFSLFGKNDS